MSGTGSEELKKCPPPSPSVLWFVNGCERKPRQKKKLNEISKVNDYFIGEIKEKELMN